MSITLITAPTSEPVTMAEVKAHLRLGTTDGEPAPIALSAALAGSGAGNVDDGDHAYKLTFVTADGETEGGAASGAVTVADKASDGQIDLTSIPLGGSAVTSRKIYRTTAGGSTYKLLATISDNTTTTYTDNIADSSLGTDAPTTNTTLDPQLNRLIISARRWAEGYMNRALVTQTWDLILDYFPASSAKEIEMPVPPLQSVTTVTYTDTDGATQTWASSKYTVDTGGDLGRGRIIPAFNEVWPTTRAEINAVTIRFVAGFGDPADVPNQIKDGMLMALADKFEMRQGMIVGTIISNVKQNAQWMLDPYRSVRVP